MYINTTCSIPPGAHDYGVRGTSWKLMTALSGACTVVTMIVSLSLIILHLTRYRAPKEQRQIIRIVFSVVVYSLVAFFEIFSYDIAQYIDPIGDVYEAFGLCALYLLYIQYAVPSGTFNDETLDAVKEAEEGKALDFDWPRIGWILVFQYPIVEILSVAIQETTEVFNRYCNNSLAPWYAHLWVMLLQAFSIGPCIYAIFAFRGHVKNRLKVRRALAKLACFKIIVFIRFIQAWVFSMLLQYHVIKPGAALSYNDILWGIPAVNTCVEMVLFSLGFWYAFSSTEYSTRNHPRGTPLPLWRAVLNALNPWDLIMGIARIFPLCGEMHRAGDFKRLRAARKERGLGGAIRKGVRKYQNRKGDKGGRYQELDEGMESLTQKPDEAHHARTESDTGYYPTSGMSEEHVYQPPAGLPPQDETSAYLMADTRTNRTRAQSVEQYGPGYQDGRSPSPAGRFRDAPPAQERDMV